MAKIVIMIIREVLTVSSKLKNWLQQIPGTSEISIEESACALLGTIKILRRASSRPSRPLAEDQMLRMIMALT